jgi:hypothetical protein
MRGECGTYDGEGKFLQNSGGETLGKVALVRPMCRWEYNIKMDPKGIGCIGVDWFHMVQDRGQVSGSYEHGNELSTFIQCRKVLDWLRDY